MRKVFYILGLISLDVSAEQYEFCAVYNLGGNLSACFISMNTCQQWIENKTDIMTCVARPKAK